MVRSFEIPTGDLSHDVVRTEHVVPGDPPVLVRVHRASHATGPLPCIYSMHGGGYVMGNYSMDDEMFDLLCPRLGVVGVSVEYRLAPETPYPGGLEDCYRGLAWTSEHAAELVSIPSASASGGSAPAVGSPQRSRWPRTERGEVPLAFQLLDCPMLDDRQHTPSSQIDGLPVWSRESNTFGWRGYLGDRYGSNDVPCTAAPARATDNDLVGLPPAFVSVGSVDGFLDEDVEYAMRLNRVGVPTELHVYPGACHGYQMAVNMRDHASGPPRRR